MLGDSRSPEDWQDRFIVRAMDEELLVYDLQTQKVTALNAAAAQVWRASHGEADTAGARANLLRESGVHADEDTVARTLTILGDAGLVEKPAHGPAPEFRRGRREFFRRMATSGVGGAIGMMGVPTVLTILAPTPAQAASLCAGVACTAPKPFCKTSTQQCVACLSNSDCTVSQQTCSTSNTCTYPCGAACSGTTPVCNAPTRRCVQCLVSTDCKNPNLPICTSFICGTGGVL